MLPNLKSFAKWCSPGQPIHHARGLRQGDPFSPLLFLLAMESLNYIFKKAEQLGVLTPLQGGSLRFRTSLFADDVAFFLQPSSLELGNLESILQIFGKASGLNNNV